MKKLLLTLTLLVSTSFSFAQTLFSYGFNGVTASLATDGWQQTNQSTPVGASTYTIPTAPGTAFPAGAQAGTPTSYTLINFNSTTGAGTISNWLISPIVTLKDGDIISFYTQTTPYAAVPTPANTFPDRMELRLSTNGAFTANPIGGSAGLGDFTTLCVEVNPTLQLTGYPGTWTQFNYTVTGLPTETDCKFAFRYFVTTGGPDGANSNIIAIDTVSVDRALTTDSFFKSNFSTFPNPTSGLLNIANNTNIAINKAQITDMNGRIVKEVNGNSNQINISELNAGVYFLKITTDQGTGTTKIIKN